MSRPLAIAFLVLVFIAGIAAGVAVDRLLLLESPGAGRGPPPGRSHGPPPILDDLARELSLDERQRAVVDEALREAHESTNAVLERTRPEMEAARVRAREKIIAVLTAEQRARFEELERRRPPPPGGPRGPGGPGGPGGPPGGPPPFPPPGPPR